MISDPSTVKAPNADTPQPYANKPRSARRLTTPYDIVRPLISHRYLLAQLVKREVYGKYKRSRYGLFWILGQPLLLLLGYTLVFGVFLNTRFGGAGTSTEFALVLFSGLIFYNFFGEVMQRSVQLIQTNAPFVKKVVFPLQLLHWSVVIASMVHAAFSFAVWIIFSLIIHGSVPIAVLWIPAIFIPFALFTLGCAWLLSGYAVFHPDAEHLVPVSLLLLMFLSPLFYQISSVPERFRSAMEFNPLTWVLEEARSVMIIGDHPNFAHMLIGTSIAIAVAWIGLASFMANREGFADAV